MHTVFTEIGPMGGDDERDLGFPLSSIAVHGGNRIAWRLYGKGEKYTGRTVAAPGKCGIHRCMGLSSLA